MPRARQKHLANEEALRETYHYTAHRVPNDVYKCTLHEVYRTRNLPDIRAQLSIRESRAAPLCELSRISGILRGPGRDYLRIGYIWKMGDIIVV